MLHVLTAALSVCISQADMLQVAAGGDAVFKQFMDKKECANVFVSYIPVHQVAITTMNGKRVYIYKIHVFDMVTPTGQVVPLGWDMYDIDTNPLGIST